jgi:hypothetical protein
MRGGPAGHVRGNGTGTTGAVARPLRSNTDEALAIMFDARPQTQKDEAHSA